MPVLYESSWGGVRIWAREVRTEGGRTLVIHELTSGNVFPVQDRGGKHGVTRWEILFDEMTGESLSPIERFHVFNALVLGGEPHVLTHPLLGSYLARIGDFDHAVDENGVIGASAQFVPDEPVRPVSPAGSGTSAVAGDGAVTAAADEVTSQLTGIELASTMPTEAIDALERWAESINAPTRQVLTDVGRVSDMVSEEIDRLELATDLAKWPAYRALIMLGEAMHEAGNAATSEVDALFTVRTEGTISLRALVAGIYGGADAERYYDIARTLNDIRTPAWIPSGTVLQLPQRPAEARRG